MTNVIILSNVHSFVWIELSVEKHIWQMGRSSFLSVLWHVGKHWEIWLFWLNFPGLYFTDKFLQLIYELRITSYHDYTNYSWKAKPRKNERLRETSFSPNSQGLWIADKTFPKLTSCDWHQTCLPSVKTSDSLSDSDKTATMPTKFVFSCRFHDNTNALNRLPIVT